VFWDHPSFLVTLRQPIPFKALLSTIFLSSPIQNNSIGYKFFVSSHRPQACEGERYGIREVQKEREREPTSYQETVPISADMSTGVTAEGIGTHEKGVKIISSQLLKSSLVTWSIGSGQGDGQETCKMHPRLP
jgi:hypothetical protein